MSAFTSLDFLWTQIEYSRPISRELVFFFFTINSYHLLSAYQVSYNLEASAQHDSWSTWISLTQKSLFLPWQGSRKNAEWSMQGLKHFKMLKGSRDLFFSSNIKIYIISPWMRLLWRKENILLEVSKGALKRVKWDQVVKCSLTLRAEVWVW